ncbi:SMP-30/gluconolactonase/LRE family protein [Hyphococcus sp.]|uniref:SMP-30/gluconolactonase/LRE family protein n=1 Tax=Hyphococcus sp. TaxID=2038636 RepID=UPI003CCC4182
MYIFYLAWLVGAGTFTPENLSRYNTDYPEYGLSAGPDGAYLTRMTGPWGQNSQQKIYRYQDTVYSTPEWSDQNADEYGFYYSEATNTAYFISNRYGDSDIWQVEWLGNRWGSTVRLPEPVNSDSEEYSAVVSPTGKLCFSSDRPGGQGQGDFYCARQLANDEWKVEPLADLNSPMGEWNLDFSPDGTSIIFEASGRKTNKSASGDLYISFLENERWSAAIPLSLLNTQGSDLLARFNKDGSVVYSSSKDGDSNLYYAPNTDLEVLAAQLVAVARSSGHVVLLDADTLKENKRIYVGQGPHDIASSEDGRIAIAPLHGVYPAPHQNPISPSQLQWQSVTSSGVAVIDLVTGESELYPLDKCPRPHGAAISAQGSRAWITCEESAEIRELDPASGKIIRTIKTKKGVHKVLLLEQSKKLFASNPQAGEVYIIDTDNGAIDTIITGSGAEAIAASPDEKTLWVANSFDKNVCAIDITDTRQLTCHESGGAFPIALAVDDDAGKLWILRNASSDLASISLSTGAIIDEIALPSRPLGLAFDARERRLFATLPRRNEIIIINADTGEIDQTTTGVMEADDLDLVPGGAFETSPDT